MNRRPARGPGLGERLGDWWRARREASGARGGRPRSNRARYNPRHRLMLVGGVMGLCAVALVARAFTLQVVNSEFYRKQGDERILREIEIPTSRGMITDRNGEPLAVSTPVESVWGNPQELVEVPDRIPELAAALGVPADELVRRISQRATREFMYLKRRINPDQAQAILAHEIPGVYSQREFRRFYPQGEALSHVLGFTNVDDNGQEGLELAFDEWLKGKPGSKRVIRDSRGRIVENVELIEAAQPGHDLNLTIDRRIQYLTFRELRKALERTGASSGSAVVLDVATGEILAMANLPTYNPNALDGQGADTRRNRAVTDVIEPGSTMKPLTVAIGLESGAITPASVFDTNPGWIPNGRYRTTDHRNYGVLDTTGVIRKSSNVGAAKIVHRIDDKVFYDFLRRMGYGSSTHSGFPGESSGVLPVPGSASWYGTTKQGLSYGYGLSATPLQIAAAYAALGNGGRLIAPTFVKGQRNEARQVLDPAIASEVLHMMQTVTEPGGTATQAAILGYHVAGKTGTARKFNASGGYSRRYISFFAGLVPVEAPRFSMVVVIDDPDPAKGYFGGLVSAPVFKSVMDGALRLMDVPPDDIETWLAAQAEEDARRSGATPPLAAAAVPRAGAQGGTP
ncbi:penicillin-binding protein 2 [Marilutibacter aestuarii]|uniref:Peptidoglycan D,D-transpeptidase FtsI n=2 Tax=Marilutibacter aestuarii TaxID=1706195 RepID=A0A508APM9_9GAMM|nr:penicillin-binding protein 2 [Lysobacter aestuarii]